jgi:hypothetical protein
MEHSRYCKHGTYIGDPYGPDYMCHWCEMGQEPPKLKITKIGDFRINTDLPRSKEVNEFIDVLESLVVDGCIGETGLKIKDRVIDASNIQITLEYHSYT